MLAELASDLLAKVQGIEALADRTSLTVGGKSQDPDLLKIPLPAAWAVMRKEAKDVSPYDHTDTSGMVDEYTLAGIWTVTVILPYTTDENMISEQYPLLESVRKALHKTETADGAMRWAYMGMVLRMVYTDRLAYEQTYHVNYVTSS
jgi:hypothetical protein